MNVRWAGEAWNLAWGLPVGYRGVRARFRSSSTGVVSESAVQFNCGDWVRHRLVPAADQRHGIILVVLIYTKFGDPLILLQ